MWLGVDHLRRWTLKELLGTIYTLKLGSPHKLPETSSSYKFEVAGRINSLSIAIKKPTGQS